MDTYVLVLVFVLGAVIGSFLNVVAYRMHTGRSINGRSHCMSCGETLQWYELLPIMSYVALRAHCRSCGAYIPYRYLAVEVLTGAMFLLMFSFFGAHVPMFVLYALLGSVLILITVYDLRHTIIPDELSLATGGVALIIKGYEYLYTGQVSMLWYDILAGLGAAAFFYALWRFSKGRWMGLGDAKLALPLGIVAGVSGALSMVVLSFWIGALISLSLLLLGKLIETGKTMLRFPFGQLTMKSEVPFAPFLILGFLLAHLFHVDIFSITSFITGV